MLLDYEYRREGKGHIQCSCPYCGEQNWFNESEIKEILEYNCWFSSIQPSNLIKSLAIFLATSELITTFVVSLLTVFICEKMLKLIITEIINRSNFFICFLFNYVYVVINQLYFLSYFKYICIKFR